MKQKFNVEDDIVIVELAGDIIGGPDAGELSQKINDFIAESQINIIIDLSQVELMNSSGLGLLIGSLTSLRQAGGDLVLVNVTERIKNLLKITKLESVFKAFTDIESAKDFFKNK
ncbi:MAG: STAS domain-containing protein [bacterium]|nr:STAS domain-containing protein [bacterium]